MLKGNNIVVGVIRGQGEFEGKDGNGKIQWSNTKIICLERNVAADSNGFKVSEYKGDYELFDKFAILPATYELSVEVTNGKTKVIACEFVGEAVLSI